jgi:hypothetical protein
MARGVDLSLSTRKRSGGARDQEEQEGRFVQFFLLFDLILPPTTPCLSSLLLTQQLWSWKKENVNGIFALSNRAEGGIIWRTSGDFYHVLSCCSALNRFDCSSIVTDKEIEPDSGR